MNLFGKKKKDSIKSMENMSSNLEANTMNTIKLIRENLEIIDKRECHINAKINAHINDAIHYTKTKNKSNALIALKRKKTCETELLKLQGSKLTLESQIMALENASVNMQILKSLNTVSNTMKKLRNDMNEDGVENIMESIEEEKEINDLINYTISRPFDNILDDADLLQELEELNNSEDSNNNMILANSSVNFPTLPIHQIQTNNYEIDQIKQKKTYDAVLL